MDKQYCDIVVVSRYSTVTVADESVNETFRMIFEKNEIHKRTFSTHLNTITLFHINGKTIDQAKVKKFEGFLASNGYFKLHTAMYSDPTWKVDVRFFTINLNPHHFSDIKDLLISKIETALGKKLEVYEDIYYFNLTKAQMKSRRLVRLIDELISNPAIEIVICI